jgi:hypothetical protein
MKTISSIATDRAFKVITTLSCLGLVLSFGLMAIGVDVNAAWFVV